MDPQISTALSNLLIAVVIAVITILSLVARKAIAVGGLYLEKKLGETTYNFLKAYVTTTVNFIEQLPEFKNLTGPEKKDEAINDVVVWCMDHNIPVDHDLIERLIEEAVKAMQPYLTEGSLTEMKI